MPTTKINNHTRCATVTTLLFYLITLQIYFLIIKSIYLLKNKFKPTHKHHNNIEMDTHTHKHIPRLYYYEHQRNPYPFQPMSNPFSYLIIIPFICNFYYPLKLQILIIINYLNHLYIIIINQYINQTIQFSLMIWLYYCLLLIYKPINILIII